MKTAIFQLLIIEDMIKIEFKVTLENGHVSMMEKLIETPEDYEAFKNEMRFGVATLDDIIGHAINRKDKACLVSTKNKENDKAGNNPGNTTAA